MSYVFRKHRRVELDCMARILSTKAEPICDCALIDVSQGGARLAVLASDMVPDEFLLTFSGSSDVSRRCKTMWRGHDEVGITFLKTVDTAKAMKASRIARLLETPCP
jgi:hypothetical protein